MKLITQSPKKALKAFLKQRPSESEREKFKNNLIALLDKISVIEKQPKDESEEHLKNNLRDFLRDTYYIDSNAINTTASTTVVDVNDAPVAVNSAKTTNEDTALILLAADFGFSDALDAGGLGSADTLLSVRIDTLPAPTSGSLSLNGTPVTAGQVIAATALLNNSTGLVFTPVANVNGQTSFSFSVRDNGGTANGGVDWSASTATMALTISAVNDAPVVVNALSARSTLEDQAFSWTVPANTFNDVDTGDTLTYSATLASGAALPTWLSFNTGTRTFSGTPTNADVGTISVKVTATDGSNAAVSSSFALTVVNTNDAPTVAHALLNRSATEDTAFSYTFAADSFNDVDLGDSLTYSATLADGSSLPTWLSFTPGTRTFSGTPANGDVGSINVKVTATDSSNASASSSFTLAVANTNDAPTVAHVLLNQSATEDSAFSYTFAADSFNDVDVGDSLTYAATLADGSSLPTWMSFNPDTRSFSGTPVNGDVGNLSVRVTATDGSNATASSTFNLAVANTNDAPTVAHALPDQNTTEDTAFSYTFAANSFNDVDVGDTLTYSATLADGTLLPTWLSFTPGTRSFSGTPTNGDVGTISVKVTATDGSSAATSSTFTLAVANVNDAPTVAHALPNQSATEDTAFSYTFARHWPAGVRWRRRRQTARGAGRHAPADASAVH